MTDFSDNATHITKRGTADLIHSVEDLKVQLDQLSSLIDVAWQCKGFNELPEETRDSVLHNCSDRVLTAARIAESLEGRLRELHAVCVPNPANQALAATGNSEPHKAAPSAMPAELPSDLQPLSRLLSYATDARRVLSYFGVHADVDLEFGDALAKACPSWRNPEFFMGVDDALSWAADKVSALVDSLEPKGGA
jgi:hypothetical protein